MKMTFFKTAGMVVVMSLFATVLFAQKTYVTVNAQYGFSTGNPLNSISITQTGTTKTTEINHGSLGNGLSAGGAFGYMFTNNIGAELGISYFSGGKYEASYSAPNYTDSETYSSKMLQINPSLIISAGLKKINPYAKFGLVMGSGSIMYVGNGNDNGDIIVTKIKYNGGLAWGLNAGVGVLYSLNDKMSLFGQVNMTDMTYAPTKGEYTEVTFF